MNTQKGSSNWQNFSIRNINVNLFVKGGRNVR